MRYTEIIAEARLTNDEAARMARAKAMGFDIDHVWYHGTPNSIRKFDMRRFGRASGSYHEVPAIFLTSDPGVATDYANVGREKMTANNSLNWGNFREHFLVPMQAILDEPSDYPGAVMMRGWALMIFEGKIDLDAIEREKWIDPAIMVRVRRLLAAYHGLEQEMITVQGSRVMPLLVRGTYTQSRMTDNFDEFMYDLHLRHAIKNKADGVWFKSVVDTTSGYGEAADVLAVLSRNLIRSKFARFDPAKLDSPDLMA